jgi:hypothetical protein
LEFYKADHSETQKLILPYLVVLSQECDLENDFDSRPPKKESKHPHDKFLQSILVCPAYPAEKLRKGTHLESLELTMQHLNSKKWNDVKNNDAPRYHFLSNDDNLQIPNLVLDFKHYYTIPREILYQKKDEHYLATINLIFRENLSQRFAFYLSRIGLPVFENE